MKIVVVASLAYSLTNFRGRLLQAMVDAGHEVVACAPEHDPEVEDRLAAMGIAYRRVPMARAGLNPFADIATLIWLVRLFRRERPAIVLAYTQKPIIYGGIASRLAGQGHFYAMVSGLGHVFGEEGSRPMRLLRAVVSVLYRWALMRAKAVFVFNGDDRGEMLRHRIIGAKTNVVQVPGSGVDLAHYARTPVPQGAPVFLMIARLLRSKGLDEYVAAARMVRVACPGAVFRLLGPMDPGPAGVGQAEIDAWAREGIIEYLGESRDVRPYLAACSVFVLPSWYREGLPRTILEAMATGRAVITTDMPGCREPIDEGGNGYVVPPRDAPALARRMMHFAEVPSLAARMGNAARQTAEERFAVERVNAILLGAMGIAPGSRDAAQSSFPAGTGRLRVVT